MQPAVYIDVLFLLNFFINLIILYLTSVASKRNVSLLFLSLGAIIGAIYSCTMFFPSLAPLSGISGKLIFSVLLVMLTFRVIKIKNILKVTAMFYLISFALGGAVFGTLYFSRAGTALGMIVSNGELYLNLPIGILMVGILFGYGGVVVFTRLTRKNFENERVLTEAEITLGGKKVTIPALIDTGSELCEPTSGKPVIVVEIDRLKEILPEDIAGYYSGNEPEDIEKLLHIMERNKENYIFSLIPFSSLGSKNSIMLGITPERVSFVDKPRELNNCVIGICKNKLSPSGEYFALVNSDVIL